MIQLREIKIKKKTCSKIGGRYGYLEVLFLHKKKNIFYKLKIFFNHIQKYTMYEHQINYRFT